MDNVWTTIIIEAHCCRKTSCKKHKYNYIIISFDPLKTKKTLNKEYDPEYKTPRKPKYCPDKPQYICLEKGCRHFYFNDADKEEYLWDNEYWDKIKENE